MHAYIFRYEARIYLAHFCLRFFADEGEDDNDPLLTCHYCRHDNLAWHAAGMLKRCNERLTSLRASAWTGGVSNSKGAHFTAEVKPAPYDTF